ncbi:MAG: hypothetical protein IH859_01440 [Chloroflexi bacterium]|nr:hypothetical protein [Chloroflexota bacterium]
MTTTPTVWTSSPWARAASKRAQVARSTLTHLYFLGGFYEVTDLSGANTITRYYGIGGQRVAKYDGWSTPSFYQWEG